MPVLSKILNQMSNHKNLKKSEKPVTVFFSYSHKDEKMRERLEAHLSILKKDKIIDSWYDRKITPGTEWKGKIDEHLKSADIILLLVSADFLASDYCYDIELKTALTRHENNEAFVVPIIFRPCEWPLSPIGKLQALPRDGKPVCNYPTQDHAFNEITRGIRRVIEELGIYKQKQNDDPLKEKEQKKDPIGPSMPSSGSNEIRIPESIIQKLQQMRIINALIKTDEEALFDDDLINEYRNIKDEMVKEFLPLVKLLSKAGLLTLSINIDDIDSIGEYSSVTGEPTVVFDNGNIWIDSEHSGGVLKRSSEDKV